MKIHPMFKHKGCQMAALGAGCMGASWGFMPALGVMGAIMFFVSWVRYD